MMTIPVRSFLVAVVAAGVVALLAPARPAAAADKFGIEGELTKVNFLVGEWSIHETHFDPDGNVVEEETTGPMMVQPVLKGTYLVLVGGDGVPSVDQANLVWLLTHHEGKDAFVAHGFFAEDPEAARVEGRWEKGALVLTSDPRENAAGQTTRFRVTITPGEEEVETRIDVGVDGRWFKRTEERWTRWAGPGA